MRTGEGTASFELLGGALLIMVKTRRRRAPHMGWEFMWRTGIVGEDVGSSPGIALTPHDHIDVFVRRLAFVPSLFKYMFILLHTQSGHEAPCTQAREHPFLLTNVSDTEVICSQGPKNGAQDALFGSCGCCFTHAPSGSDRW